MDNKELRKLKRRLIDDENWDVEEFERMKEEFDDDPEKYKPLLGMLLREINLSTADEYNYNYGFSLYEVVQYSGGYAFLKPLSDELMPKGWSQDQITERFEEYFQAYSDGGEPISVIEKLSDVFREGLQSTNLEYKQLSQKFLGHILSLLRFIVRERRPSDPYQDEYVKSILGLLVSLYRFYDAKLIDQTIKEIPRKYHDFYFDQKKQYEDFRKEFPGSKY